MSNSLYFLISAVILSITLLASVYLRYRMPTKENKLLMTMVWLISISTVLDLILTANGYFFQLSKIAGLLLNTIYVVAKHVATVCFAVYVVVSTDQRLNKKMQFVLHIFNGYGLALIILNIKFRWLFNVDDGGHYISTEKIYLYLIVAVFYLMFSLQHLIRFGKKMEAAKKISLYMFILVPYFCAALQYLYPNYRIETFGLNVAMLWIYLNAPKMDLMVDSTTGVFNQYAFSKKYMSFTGQKKTYLVVMRFRERIALQNQYGIETYMKLMREVAFQLYTAFGRENVFYLKDGRFVFEIVKNSEAEAKILANQMLKSLQKTWEIYGKEVDVWLVAALLVLPEDVKNLNDIYNYLEYLEIMPSLKDGNVYEGKHLDIAYMRRYDEIERAIDRALQKTSFNVYYQPIYGTKENKVVAAEALLRMYDEDLGFVSPEEFIPIAEKNGKIVEIGHMVLENVCQFLQKENIREYGIHYIEVNLSTIECIQENLPEELESILRKYHVDVSQINLEITETALAQKEDILAENMGKISEMGITFSLDDYGTGYSTITYMMTLPFKIVKIDKSILWSSFENEKAMIALCATVNMIKDMDMEIVVEGVESEEMANKLAELGCDYLQGYYYSKPLPEEEFVEFIAKNK